MSTPLNTAASHGLARLYAIARALRRGRRFSAPRLAAEHGVSERTLKRDIQLLRALGWQIRWDVPTHSYYLESAPKPQI